MISATQPWQSLSRNDRHVRRASLRLPAGVSEHRAAFLVEEALRLMSLPGEEQGRMYYFRRVALRGLAAVAPLNEWIESTQGTMCALAARALHGGDSRAADADAVFFNSQQEALEWLLDRLIRASPRALSPAEWFAKMIAPSAFGADATMQVVAVIERLRNLPSGWFAAATALLCAVESDSAAFAALESIPERVIQMWFRELGGASGGDGHAPRISESRRRMLHRRLAGYVKTTPFYGESTPVGVKRDAHAGHKVRHEAPPYLILLAALAVVAEHPSELARGRALGCGQSIIEELAEHISRSASDRRDHAAPSSSALLEGAPDGLDGKRTAVSVTLSKHKHLDAGEGTTADPEGSLDHSLLTGAGGLYFLLNALRLLGVEDAIEALPSPLRRAFLPRLMESLALSASVAKDDPVWLWIDTELDKGCTEAKEDVGCVISGSACWPVTFFTSPEIEVTPARLIRVWTVAVKRWCWLCTRLTLREIASRPGRILLTRTELDITLSMDTVDLRLRRAGLDLDPGWLPWFGRVVRFHYVHKPSPNGSGRPA